MSEISRDRLSAYLDGELGSEDRQRVEEALAASPHLRAELERMRDADEALRQAMAAVFADRPLPEALRTLIGEETAAAHDRHGRRSLVGRFRRRLSALRAPGGGMAMVRPALAAAAMLLIGIAIGVLLPAPGFAPAPTGEGKPVRLALDAVGDPLRLAGALERTPSGARRRLDTSGKIWVEPVMTFRDGHGKWCREFRIGRADAGKPVLRAGIACRQPGGGPAWRVVALAPLEDAAALIREAPPGTFRPAADASLPAALGSLLTRMIKTGPLDPARERELLANGWQGKAGSKDG